MTSELCFLKTYRTVFQDSMDNGCKEFNDNLRPWTVLAMLPANSVHYCQPLSL